MNEADLEILRELHDESPQRDLLELLQSLSEHWGEYEADTHAREMARGMLIIARGIEACEEGVCRGQLRLTVSGKRWRDNLSVDPSDPTRRYAVLRFIHEAYAEGKTEFERANPSEATTGDSVADPDREKLEKETSGSSEPQGPSEKPRTRGNHRCIQIPAPSRDCSGVLDAVTRKLTIDYYDSNKHTTLTHKQVEILVKGGKADAHGILHFTNATLEAVYGKIPTDEKQRKKWHDKVRSGLRELRKRVTFSDGGLLTDNPNAIQHSPRAKGTPSRIQTRIEKSRWNTTIPILVERKPA
jgi:hypothetical protein